MGNQSMRRAVVMILLRETKRKLKCDFYYYSFLSIDSVFS